MYEKLKKSQTIIYSQDLQILEITCDYYPTLEDVQRTAICATAYDLTVIARSMLASGRLVQRGNQIVINPKG